MKWLIRDGYTLTIAENERHIREKNKGITLIALVLTIIVLLILAGVSIAMLTGENGIINQANTAKEETKKATALEKVQVEVLGSYGKDGKINIDNLNTNLENVEGLTSELPIKELPAKVVVDGYEMTIDVEGKAKKPQGEIINAGDTAELENKKYESDGKIAIIPEGFKVSNKQGETSINNGLVVLAPDKSEFVWIPVDKNTFDTKFKRTEGYKNGKLDSRIDNCGEAGANGENSKIAENEEIKKEAREMYASVKSNGGFYIARYEAGIEGETARTETSGITDRVVSKKDKHVYNFIGWSNSETITEISGGAVEKARGMATENGYKGVKSTLCYSVQWDVALNFIDPNYITNETTEGKPNCSVDSYLVESTGKGWYNNNRSKNAKHKTGIDVDTEKSNKVKNIYDMAGNVWERTMESYGADYRIVRGGSFDFTGIYFPASTRPDTVSSNRGVSDMVGFRPTLYVNI